MTTNQTDTSAAHSRTVRQIISAAENTWKALLKLQASDRINPDGVLIDDDRHRNVHPQKQAHSYLLGYHQLLANRSYTVNASDLWQEPLQLDNGEEYTIDVPKADASVDIDEEITIENLETTEEPLTLETLYHRWGFRYITVQTTNADSWVDHETAIKRKRLWLPPRGIGLAFEQLEDVRTTINLAADIQPDDWDADKVIDPDGMRDPYNKDD